jgi:hypothetical protein
MPENYLPDIQDYDYFKFPPLEKCIEDSKIFEAPVQFQDKKLYFLSQSKASPQSTNIPGEAPENFQVFESEEIKEMRKTLENSTPMDFDISDSSFSKSPMKIRKRGPYRRYSSNLRFKAIQLCNKINNAGKVASILNIPIKNLRRWIVTGPNRKTGGFITRRETIS